MANEAKLQAFLARALYDIGAAQSAALVALGDRLGLYKAMAGAGPLTPGQLAERTGTSETYLREWLANQACGGYVEYDPGQGTFSLPEEQAQALAREDSPAFVVAVFRAAAGLASAQDALADAFRSGRGVPREAYGPELADATGRVARARYTESLLRRWLGTMPGTIARLETGASVTDLGCGQGAVLLALARAFPRSRFAGYDTHAASIEAARRLAREAGLGGSARFEVAAAADFPGDGYDLVTCFESFHEMADPLRVARRVRAALAGEGAWLIVEPYASGRLEDDLGPWGRLVSSMSALHCLPVSLADGGGALGPRAGAAAIAEVVRDLLRLASFIAFLILGFRVTRVGEGVARRRAINRLLAYVLGLSGAVGLLQWDDWPFTSHTIAVGRARADSRVCTTELFGVDDGGREWRLDPYSFTPVYHSILQYWLEQAPGRLSEAQRGRALGFLLERAEESRRRLAAGRALGHERILGPAGAPYWLLLPRSRAVPASPYAGLRAYSSCWTVAEGPGRPVSRRVLAEHRR
jgi:SAM-dependent methyltransferase